MVVGLLLDLIVGRICHFALGNLNSHSCKIYFAGSNYNCMPNTTLSNIYNFPISIRHKKFPCQLYDLSNPSLFDVQHVDDSSVPQKARNIPCHIIWFYESFCIWCSTCWTLWCPIPRQGTECGPKTTNILKFLDGLFAKWLAQTIFWSMTI
jgi:hypothetical protein